MKFLYLFFLVLILFSCTQKHTTVQPVAADPGHVAPPDSVVTIKVNTPKSIKFNIDDKLHNVQYIPLETNRRSLIGEISKVIYYNGRFYILDSHIAQSVFIFDKNGKFINKIDRKGRGPGEFLRIYDFDIDRCFNQIVMVAGEPLKFMRNTIDGKFISEKRLPSCFWALASLTDKTSAIYLNYMDNTPFVKKEYNLLYMDSLANFRKGFLPYGHSSVSNYFYKGKSFFYTYKNATYFHPALVDTVYRLGMKQLTPVYAFDFGSEAFDKAILQEDITEQDNYFKKNAYVTLFNMNETDSVLYFSFSGANHLLYHGYYSKRTGKILVGAACMNTKYYLGDPVGGNDEFAIEQLTPLRLLNFRNRVKDLPPGIDPRLLTIINSYKEADNPVLVTYRINF